MLLGINYWAAHRVIQETRIRVPYSPFFLQQVRAGNVVAVTSTGSELQGDFEQATKPRGRVDCLCPLRDGDPVVRQHEPALAAPPAAQGRRQREAARHGAPVVGAARPRLRSDDHPSAAPLLALPADERLAGGGRLRPREGASLPAGRETVTFADVAGIDEAKQELTEIVDFLRDPDKYRRLGGRIPRGVLLSGPPGTGKTLLARAVAGEAGAPFFSMSASEFVEAIVGVGASRVRDLFRQAKQESPAIVFIDELDAVGRARSTAGGYGGGSDEREQTLNQILTEMDGFDSSTAVIVIGATNRIDVLDQALLRPGRFDRRVVVQAAGPGGTAADPRGAHARRAARAATSTSSGSQRRRREWSAPTWRISSTRRRCSRRGSDRSEVEAADFTQSLEKIILGAERKIMLTPDDRRRTAYHEAGHALVGMLTPGADPVRKISIVPRGQALGVTLSSPDVDRFNYSRAELEARVKMTLGGRAAEEVVFGDQTTGAEGDIAQVTALVRQMVGRWGMSDTIGMVAVLPRDGANPWGDMASPRTLELFDEEVRRTVESAYEEVSAC